MFRLDTCTSLSPCAVQLMGRSAKLPWWSATNETHSLNLHSEPQTRTPKPLHTKPETPNPNNVSPNTKHQAPNLTPQTQNPKPKLLTPDPHHKPIPRTPNPKPQPPSHQPLTLNPNPKAVSLILALEQERCRKGTATRLKQVPSSKDVYTGIYVHR